MERRGLIIGVSVGVAALLIVVCVGFLLPSGSEDAGDETRMGDRKPMEPVLPRAARQGRTAEARREPVAAITEEQKEDARDRWSSMSESDREDFRSELREKLIAARRDAVGQRAKIKEQEAARENELAKQRMESLQVREGNSPEVEMP